MKFSGAIVVFAFLFAPAPAMILSGSSEGLLFGAICAVSSLVYTALMRRGKGGRICYTPLVISAVFMLLARGYFSAVVQIIGRTSSLDVLLVAVSMAFSECGIIMGRNLDSINAYKERFQESGYEPEELEAELEKFTLHVQNRMMRVLGLSLLILLAVFLIPAINLSPLLGISGVGIIILLLLRRFTAEKPHNN